MNPRRLYQAAAIVPLMGGLLLAQPVWAQDSKAAPAKKGDNVDRNSRSSSPQTQAVATAAMASQLRAYGDRNKDPMALISAARILQEVGVRDEPRKPTTKADKPAATGMAQPAARDDSVAGILARAKEYAKGRADLIALANEVEKSTTRGRTGGPAGTVTNVQANSRDTFDISFRGGEPALVAISGDGDTDLDLLVYDENGRLICRADGFTDDEICRWTPAWTATFRVVVVNLGRVYNRYRLWTN